MNPKNMRYLIIFHFQVKLKEWGSYYITYKYINKYKGFLYIYVSNVIILYPSNLFNNFIF